MHQISHTFDYTKGENIVLVADNNIRTVIQEFPSFGNSSWSNGYLSDLRVSANITSIPEAAMPAYNAATDTQATKLAKSLESKWNDARIHLATWISDNEEIESPSDWDWAGDLSLQNQQYYPYIILEPKRVLTTNLDWAIGRRGKVGLSLKAIQWEGQLLKFGQGDQVTVRGNWRQEVFSLQPDIQPVPVIFQGSVQQIQQRYEEKRWTMAPSGGRQTIMDLKDMRVSGVFRYTGSANSVYIKQGGLVTTSDYNFILNSTSNLRTLDPGYHGIVTALASGGQAQFTTEETYNIPLTV